MSLYSFTDKSCTTTPLSTMYVDFSVCNTYSGISYIAQQSSDGIILFGCTGTSCSCPNAHIVYVDLAGPGTCSLLVSIPTIVNAMVWCFIPLK